MAYSAYQNLVNRGPLILVSIEYRLGPFGTILMSTRPRLVLDANEGCARKHGALGPDCCSDLGAEVGGNCVTALRYIRFFGGDPRRVTIGGFSAGSWSVSAISMIRRADGSSGLSIRDLEVSGARRSCTVARRSS